MRVGAEALGEMRRARRSRYVERLDTMEILYRIYVGGIFGAIVLGVLAGALHEASASRDAVEAIRTDAPAILGLVVALGMLAGLRSGARGGPLAIEAAEVQYALLAPVDRGAVLRPAALSQARIAAGAGAVTGAVVGNFVFRRYPGSPVEWIACLALFGALAPLCALGAAMLASGRRVKPLAATLLGGVIVAWSIADLVLGSTSSPATMLGDVATLPLQRGAAEAFLPALGAVAVLALLVVGLVGVGGLLLEAARRRAALTAELRFSASVQDLRTVVLLRRQLASELPRRRPWLRLPPARGVGRPIWRRGWQSFLRWPPARVARVATIGVAAGAVAVAAWSQTPFLFVFPGGLLFIAALDLIEPLAQEADHPTRSELLPLAPARLIQRHLAAPAAGIAAVLALGTIAAAAVGAAPATALGVGAVMLFPTAAVLACAAALSATNDPYEYILVPALGTFWSALPIAIAAVAVALPLIAAWASARAGGAPVPVAAAAEAVMLLVAAGLTRLIELRMAKRDVVTA